MHRSQAADAKASRNLALGADTAVGIGALAAIGVIAIVGARAAKRKKSREVEWMPAAGPAFGRGAFVGKF